VDPFLGPKMDPFLGPKNGPFFGIGEEKHDVGTQDKPYFLPISTASWTQKWVRFLAPKTGPCLDPKTSPLLDPKMGPWVDPKVGPCLDEKMGPDWQPKKTTHRKILEPDVENLARRPGTIPVLQQGKSAFEHTTPEPSLTQIHNSWDLCSAHQRQQARTRWRTFWRHRLVSKMWPQIWVRECTKFRITRKQPYSEGQGLRCKTQMPTRNVQGPMSHVPCPMSHVPCPMSLCMSHVPCPMSTVPCPLSHVPCRMSNVPGPRSQISRPRSRSQIQAMSQVPGPRSYIPGPTSKVSDPRSHQVPPGPRFRV
jgi:hypothetical protein